MAERRMFSKRIIGSARFLRMPISTQALYFHLGLHADDDGIVEAYPVIKLVGCTEDDLKVLVAKGFVQVLNEDLVSYITDWLENNRIRADRKIDSVYKDLLLSINPTAEITEKRQRTVNVQPNDNQMTTNCQPSDNQMTTICQPNVRIGKDRIGKDRIGKDNIDKAKRFVAPTLEEIKTYCSERKNNVDAQRFLDYYTANGWKVGRNPMKDWKAAVRTWEKNGFDNTKEKNKDASYDVKKWEEMASNYIPNFKT